MNYRSDKYGNQISVLGYGCMRFPQTLGRIDMKETEKQIMAAFQAGVNYFDTAYIYHGSEAALGEILEKNGIRDQVRIATKLPHYMIKSTEGLEKIFTEECRRLRTDYIDHYLMHMLNDTGTWERLKALGIEEWLEKKREEGAIRQIGFSYHGSSDAFCRLLDAYDWDFCMIQYNYMDENQQAGRKGLLYAHEKGIPVVIMEPLRGGRLVNFLPDEAKRIFAEYPIKRTPAEWAFRWLWNQPEVTCVLSGMNSMEMIEENVKTASEACAGELTEADEDMLRRVVGAINATVKIGCTGCGYCMPCPKNVDIPGAFSAYNHRYSEGRFKGFHEYILFTALRKTSAAASNCVGCGKCETHCPQSIEIRKELKTVQKQMERLPYKFVRKAVQVLKLYG